MKKHFTSALEDAASYLVRPDAKSDAALYLRQPERVSEAARLNSIADAFTSAELNGVPSGRPLGMYGPKLIPPIGELLGRKFEAASSAQREAAHAAVLTALARGYAVFAMAEPGSGIMLRAGTEPEAIWDYTVHRFRGAALEELRFDQQMIQMIHRYGADALVEGLREAGLLRRQPRVAMAGRHYGQAGALMRMAQTDYLALSQLRISASVMPRWPYQDFVTP